MPVTPPQYYSTVADVIEDCGIQPVDMGFEDITDSSADEQLNDKIVRWLIDAKAMIDADRDRNFSEDFANGDITAIPICIHNIAKRITINMANSAKLNRKSPTIKVNDYQIKPVSHDPFTSEIKKDLETCCPTVELSGDTLPFRVFNIDSSLLEDDLNSD